MINDELIPIIAWGALALVVGYLFVAVSKSIDHGLEPGDWEVICVDGHEYLSLKRGFHDDVLHTQPAFVPRFVDGAPTTCGR